MNKRILSVLLVAVMAVALVIGAISVSAADRVENDDEFKDAIKTESRKITLEKDITVTEVAVVTKNTTIDLNGYTLTIRGINVSGKSTLTITDSDKDNYGELAVSPWDAPEGEDRGLTVEAGSTLIIDDGYIHTYNKEYYPQSTNAAGIYAEAGTVIIRGGNVGGYTDEDGDHYDDLYAVYVSDGTVNVTGGTVYGETAAIYIDDGKLNVSGGTVKTTTANAIEVVGGKTNITGGKVVATSGNALYAEGGTVNVEEGATITADNKADSKGTAIKVVKDGYVEVYGGAINAYTAIDTAYGEGMDVHGGSYDGAISCGDKEAFIIGGDFSANTYTQGVTIRDLLVKKHANASWVTKTINNDGVTREYVGDAVVKAQLTASEKTTFIVHFGDLDFVNEKADVVVVYDNYDDTKDKLDDSVVANGYALTSAMQPGYQDNANDAYSADYKYAYYEFNADGTIKSVKNASLLPKNTNDADELRSWTKQTKTELTVENHLTKDGLYLEDCYVDKLHPTAGTYKFQVKVDETGAPVNTAAGCYNGNPAAECTKSSYMRPGTYDRSAEKDVGKDIEEGIGAYRFDGHRVTAEPFKQPTATEDGQYQHYKCVICGKTFATFLGQGSDNIELVEYDPTISKLAAETTAAPAETTAAPAETTAAPAETTAAPAETTKAPAETTAAPAETTAAPETQAPTPVTPSETGDNGMNALVWVIVLGAAVAGVAVASKSVLASKKH